MAMQQWQDGPAHILEAAWPCIQIFKNCASKCSKKFTDRAKSEKLYAVDTNGHFPAMSTQTSILLAQFQVVLNEISFSEGAEVHIKFIAGLAMPLRSGIILPPPIPGIGSKYLKRKPENPWHNSFIQQ